VAHRGTIMGISGRLIGKGEIERAEGRVVVSRRKEMSGSQNGREDALVSHRESGKKGSQGSNSGEDPAVKKAMTARYEE